MSAINEVLTEYWTTPTKVRSLIGDGWLSNYRRFAKDYEYHPANSEALILIAASKLMVARLAK